MRSVAINLTQGIMALALMSVAAGHAVAITPAGLERKALAAMERGDYEEAAETLTALLERVPQAPRPLYNLACCNSRLENLDRAADALQDAWDAGFRDLELIRTDPDLKNLRATKRGRRMIDRFDRALQRELRLRGQPLVFDGAVLGNARVVTPEILQPGRKYPLVVALHGNGGSSERFAGIFAAAGLSPDLIVVAPQGPYPATNINGVGYSWYPSVELFNEVTNLGGPEGRELTQRRNQLDERERKASLRYVLAAIDEVKRTHPIDPTRIFVLGFSQGGVLAYEMALTHPDRFEGIIAIGTFLREQIATPQTLAGAQGKIRALICHSPEDEAVAVGEGTSASKRLREAGIESRFVRYDGGHSLSVELLAQIAKWIGGDPVDQGLQKADP